MMSQKPAAIIFDLDGTLIDNNTFHIEAWKAFYEKKGLLFSMDVYKDQINGRINNDIFRIIMGDYITQPEIDAYGAEKEALYRELYAAHIAPINGLLGFLDNVQEADIPMGIATSGIIPNIEFMFSHISIRDYFGAVIDGEMITKGKPDPEIFLKAAAALSVDPQQCIAFEDSLAGIRSAKAAGMYVVGLSTTHTKEDLITDADWVMPDYGHTPLPELIQKWNQHLQ